MDRFELALFLFVFSFAISIIVALLWEEISFKKEYYTLGDLIIYLLIAYSSPLLLIYFLFFILVRVFIFFINLRIWTNGNYLK